MGKKSELVEPTTKYYLIKLQMENVVQEFEKFMSKVGRYYHQFYVGIATDPIDRLTKGHGVTGEIPHIYWNTPIASNMVRAIERHFLDKGCKGGPGGGDVNTNFIYAYIITEQTRQ